MRFVKIFIGYCRDIEQQINEMAHKRNLKIISLSCCTSHGVDTHVFVLFEKQDDK